MTHEGLVSVVMAAKDAERYLGQALDSVRSQTYDRYEVVLVDGGSSDRTLEIARSYPFVRALDQRVDGFAAAWNVGLEHSRGELIAFLDSDDRWAAHKLSAQVDVLAREPAVDYVLAKVCFVLEPGLTPPPGFRRQLLRSAHVAHMPGALLARRRVFDRVGLFGTDWSIASDIDWFARVKDAGCRHAVVPHVLVYKRVHDRNLSHVAAAGLNGELVRLLKQSLDRQRSAR